VWWFRYVLRDIIAASAPTAPVRDEKRAARVRVRMTEKAQPFFTVFFMAMPPYRIFFPGTTDKCMKDRAW
jgi:hypothetical protein